MSEFKLGMVMALTRQGVIGDKGKLPWHIPEDLKHFKETTKGKPIIMGRRTFESIGRALPGRLNIVVSRKLTSVPEGVLVVPTLKEAIGLAQKNATQANVIGGAKLLEEATQFCDHAHLSWVEEDIPGDTRMGTDWLDDFELCQEQTLCNNPLTVACLYERKAKPQLL